MPIRFSRRGTIRSKGRRPVSFLRSLGEHINGELVLLAPGGCAIPEAFKRRTVDRGGHARLLSAAQRVRGSIYLADGALQPSQITSDGRHVQRSDYDSWHLLAVDANGEVAGCARYRHLTGNIGFDDLGVRESWLARCEEWGRSLKAAVEVEIVRARRRGTAFSEVGGWAIVPEKRCTAEALRIAMATYGLAQLLGGCVGITTATQRHRSSSMLRRIGGRSLEHMGLELPSYYDPQYQCRMEVLRFDSNAPDESCKRWVELMSKGLTEVSVITPVEMCPVPQLQPQLQPIPAAWPPLPQLGWVA